MKSTPKDKWKKRVEKYGKTAGSAVASLLALSSFALPASLFARWCAIGILLITLPVAWQCGGVTANELIGGRFARAREVISKWLPYLAVTAIALIALGPVSLGRMPVSQDHINHYFATHILTNDMIPSGRFFGWTDRIGTGYPFGDLYSTACYLATGLLYLLSFGAIDLHVSYAFGIVLVWLIPALAAAAWARRLAGPWAAVIAGAAYVADAGGDREGGWIYAMFHGVWPQQLGVGLWLFALLALWRFTEKATTRRLAAAVLLGGLSLWIHPMNSVTLLAAGALMFAVRLLAPSDLSSGQVRRGAIRLIPALFLAGLLGLFWVARMMLAGDVVDASIAFWQPTTTLMARLLDGNLFDRQIVFIAGLSLIGAFAALRREDRFGIYSVTLPAALIVIGSMDLLMGSDLGLAGGELGFIQYRRFSIAAKPLVYALSGVGFAAVVKGIAGASGGAAGRAISSLTGRVLTAILLAPLAWALVCAVPQIVVNPVARPLTLEQAGEADEMAAMRSLLEKEKSDCGSNPCRALYWMRHGQGGLYPVMAMADAGFSFQYTLASLPANNFKWLNSTDDIEKMARLGIRIIISRWKHEHALLEKIGEFGKHSVYRIKNTSTSQVEMNGQGTVEVVAWEPELRRVKVSNAGEGASLTFLMPPYKKWRATENGKPLEIRHKKEGGFIFLEVVGVHNGEVKLEYDDSAIENAISIIAAILIVACVIGIVTRPKDLPAFIGDERLPKAYQWLAIAAGLLAFAAALALALGGKKASDNEWLAGEPENVDVAAVLHRQGPSEIAFSPSRYCVRPYVRDPDWECSERDMEPELTHARLRNGKVPSCLAIGVPPDGSTKTTFDLPAGTTRVKGRFHAISGKSITGEISQKLDGQQSSSPIGKISPSGAVFSVDVALGARQVEFLVTSKDKSRFCLEAVALSD